MTVHVVWNIVYLEVNETRNCLVSDILLIIISEYRLNGFENGETRLFISRGVVK